MTDHLYDVPPFEGEEDYLSDLGLSRIKVAILDRLPVDGFDLGYVNATPKGVQATITFDKPAGPVQNIEMLEAMLHAATVVRTLHANLVAARAQLAQTQAQVKPGG